MLYLGVNLKIKCFKITVLSESYAYLDTRYFDLEDIDRFYKWMNSYKYDNSEKCSWFFDEYNFYKYSDTVSYFELENSDIYLVNHRKLLNIIQFLYEWAVHTESYLTFDIEHSYLLASTFRIFDQDNVKYLKPKNCLF